MLAKVRASSNIRRLLRYHRKRVEQHKAECIAAENFVKDLKSLNEEDKINRFEQRTSLNARTSLNGIHISMGFKHTEVLSDEKMAMLAKKYMDEIGFGEQPYLVYRHRDTAQPHCHILGTTIRADASRIELWYIIHYKSREVTARLAEEFSLQRLVEKNIQQNAAYKVDHAQMITYGELPTKRALSNVINTVVEHYRYTSFKELNAALKEYNVTAYRGKETSTLYKLRGVLYQAIDENGKHLGAPIKASDFLLKPTLKHLEDKFRLNIQLREKNKQRMETAIEWTLLAKKPTWEQFRKSLEKEGINVVILEDKNGKPEAFFIDHRDKAVFSSQSLGDSYTLEAIRQRCVLEQQLQQEETQKHHLKLRL